MDEDRLYHDPALADFYDLENGWDARRTSRSSSPSAPSPEPG